MSRIEDIISEITRNVNSLSRQVGKARRYLKYQDELKNLEVDLARYHYTHFIDNIVPMRKSLDEISLIKEDTSQQITLEEAILEEYKRELIQSEQQINQFSIKLKEQDVINTKMIDGDSWDILIEAQWRVRDRLRRHGCLARRRTPRR